KTIVRKNKAGKRAHVIGSVPVPVKARASAPGGLPHKQVATDSKALTMPTVQHETTSEPPPAAATTPPPAEAEDTQEAQAGVDADSVRLVVRQHLPQVRACYARAFKDASPGGTVEIGFAIDGGGRAKNVRTETNTSDSEGLAHCLEARVKEWQFPRPIGGDYELIYPFVFAPGS
ncbi:MAG: AgmX/PglI C-terminal domain-containing protein, partial [Myxococcales bacterium]|nr:AgmX/PglI C-terminal domain-containing protein [Myxococcales bacterium]